MPTQTIFWPAGGSVAIYSALGFSDPTRVSADDGSYATAAATQTPGERYGNWGFDGLIPAGATITAVAAEYQYKYSASGGSKQARVFARIAGVPQVVHADAGQPTSDTVVTQDLTADRAWTRADLLNGVFELVLQATSTTSATVSYDYLKASVTYSTASPQTLSVGKVASPAAVRGVWFGAVNIDKISSGAVVYGVHVSQTGDVQFLPIGKLSSALSGLLGASWTSPAFGYTTGLAISQNKLVSGSSVAEGAALYTAAQLSSDFGASFTLTAAIPGGGRVRLLFSSDTTGTAGYTLTIGGDGTATVAQIAGTTILTYSLGALSVGDQFGLSKIGDYFRLFYRPATGDWTQPSAASGGTYDGPVYVGLSVWQTASVDDLYVDGLP